MLSLSRWQKAAQAERVGAGAHTKDEGSGQEVHLHRDFLAGHKWEESHLFLLYNNEVTFLAVSTCGLSKAGAAQAA